MLNRRLLSLTAGCALFATPGAWAQEVIWDSPPNNDLPAFKDQQYGDFPDFSTYLVAHIRLDRAYFIHDITTYFTNANGSWPNGQDNVEAVLNIIPQDASLPDNNYDPRGPQQGGDGIKVLGSMKWEGSRLTLTTHLNGGIVLGEGNWWIGLTPKISFVDFGNEFHKGSDQWLKNTAGRNPGGGFGVGTDWFDAGQTFSGIDWGMAITVTGKKVPTPGALALLGVAGLLGTRRRRRQ